jgi:dihydroorotate dehydrogenase
MNKEQLLTAIYQKGISPATRINPERAHDLFFWAFNDLEHSDVVLKVVENEFKIKNGPKILLETLGVELDSKVMIAGGVFKTGSGMALSSRLGPAAMEAGTFTLDEREGRPRVRTEISPDGKERKIKRIEKFPDGTIINWMGFPNPGIKQGIKNITQIREKINVPIYINIAQNPELSTREAIEDDLRNVIECVYDFKPQGAVVNISCPNVERKESREKRMEDALWTIKTSGRIFAELDKRFGYKMPRLIKIGPDMSEEEIKKIVIAIKEAGFDGVVATNTTVDRTGIRSKYAYIEKGGLSGPLLFEKSLETVRLVRKFDRELGGNPLVIMGCGGIGGFKDWKKMESAGADIVQVVSSFIHDPYFFKKFNRDSANDYVNNARKKYFYGKST